jgi:hypothetical protein
MKPQEIKTNQYFSLKRLLLIMKRDVLTHYRTVLIASLAVAGFAIFASTASMLNRSQGEFHLIYYFLLLYIGGFIFTSRAFREMYNGQKSYTYVTLPGSPPEKFVERWFLTSVGYVIGAFAAYFVIALISEGINRALFGYSHALLNPAGRTFLLGVAVFLVLQGMFFAGAVYFRKHPLVKTILMITLAAIALLVISIITIRVISPGYFEFTHRAGREFNSLRELAAWLGLTEEGLQLLGRTIWIVIRVLFWAVLAPCCWVLSYLKFRKIEV